MFAVNNNKTLKYQVKSVSQRCLCFPWVDAAELMK